MPSEYFTVGIVVEHRKLSNPWVDSVWLPSAVLPGVPETEAWTTLSDTGDVRRVYAGPYTIGLHTVDTANYRDNLASGAPRIWIALREASGDAPIEIAGVTADPAEGEAYTEAGGDTVEAVPMPPEIAERLAAFIAEHHVERQFYKRKRDAVDPEALASRPGRARVMEGDDDD